MNWLYKLNLFVTSFIPLWISIIFKICINTRYNDFTVITPKMILIGMFVAGIVIFNALAVIHIGIGIKRAKDTEGRHDALVIMEAEREKTITSEYLWADI